jgi:hypothetical protein
VEPLLYSDVIFNAVGPLKKLAVSLHLAELRSPGRSPGRYIQKLFLFFVDSKISHDAIDNLLAILLSATNLRTLHLYRIPSLGPVMVASMACASTLQLLSFDLPSTCSLTSLQYISRFTRLSTLNVTFLSHNETAENADISDSALLDMPLLRTLGLCLSMRPSSALLRFLSRCNFSAVRTLTFECDLVGEGNGPYIAEFLAKFSLKTASLVPHDNDEAMFVPHLKTDELSCPVTPSLLTHLHEQVRTLHLYDPIEFHLAQAFFASLLVSSTGVREIYLEDWEWCTSWTSIGDHDDEMDPDNALARVRLIQYASALAKKGIRLLDGYGKTVMEYFDQD